MKWVVVVLCSCLVQTALSKVSYDGYKVVRFFPENELEMSQFADLENKVDFWKEPSTLGRPVDIMFSPGQENLLASLGMRQRTYVEDVGKLIRETEIGDSVDPVRSSAYNTSRYYTTNELHDFLDDASADCGGFCSVLTIGKSYEGRDLKVIRISRPGSERPALWIDGGIHAREWLSPAVTSYIIDQLINGYGEDTDITLLRDTFDWYIENLVNPDGYEYTWTDDRMWRKTRSPNNDSVCVGTDGNRNYAYQWVSGSDQQCSETYSGPFPESEIEIRELTAYVQTFAASANLSLSLHTYGQEIFRPWAHQIEDPVDVDDLVRMSDLAVAAINANSDVTYTSQKSSGTNSGISMDWAKGVAGIKYAYVVEMRDEGDYGFIAPVSEILPTCVEIFAGVKAMALDLAGSLQTNRG